MGVEEFGTPFCAYPTAIAFLSEAFFFVNMRLKRFVSDGDQGQQRSKRANLVTPFSENDHLQNQKSWKHNERPRYFSKTESAPNNDNSSEE